MNILENDELIIKYDDESIIDFINDSYKWFVSKKERIFDFYEINEFRKVTVNVFVNREEFEKFILSFYDDKTKKVPPFCKGTFNGGMINVYFNKDDVMKDSNKYNGLLSSITHEYIHLVYKECIREKYNLDRLVWLDEGLANYLSDGMIAKNFKHIESLKYTIDQVLGKDFNLDEFNMDQMNFNNINSNALYVFSYTIVKYLFDTNKIDILKEILKTNNYDLTRNLFKDSVNYYIA